MEERLVSVMAITVRLLREIEEYRRKGTHPCYPGSVVATLRRTRLDPKFGSLYPEIPAAHWIPAWQAATRRAERLWRETGADALIEGRLLSEEHFQFRGGRARGVGWYVEPERLSDPTRAEMAGGN